MLTFSGFAGTKTNVRHNYTSKNFRVAFVCLLAFKLNECTLSGMIIIFFLTSGILEESLQQYGSLIPIHVDDVVEKLQDIFRESFSQPHRLDTEFDHFHNNMYEWKN